MDNLQTINHVYNYNNAVPMLDYVLDVCKYLDAKYRELEALVAQDEVKNQDLKYEYREYSHKKAYSAGYTIYFYSKTQRSVPAAHSYAELEQMKNSGLLKQLRRMTIEVNYDYGVGKDNQINGHHNEFKLSFEPYEIVFTRVSDHDNETINEIEETVKRKMNEFLYYETIFGD